MMMKLPLSKQTIQMCFPNASSKTVEKYTDALNQCLVKFQINTGARVAAFFAQLEVESGSLHYVEEIASGSAYEYRKDLGNLEPEAIEAAHKQRTTTGKFYKGHGLIQITGYFNHRDCGEALGIDLVNNPNLLSELPYSVLCAGWYWNTRNCNAPADIKDINKVTKAINGGYNGLSDRELAYYRNLAILE
jgi:putative chitinase